MLLSRIAKPIRAWAERQEIKAELENLDSRTLADLVITPSDSDVPAIVNGTYRRG